MNKNKCYVCNISSENNLMTRVNVFTNAHIDICYECYSSNCYPLKSMYDWISKCPYNKQKILSIFQDSTFKVDVGGIRMFIRDFIKSPAFLEKLHKLISDTSEIHDRSYSDV